MAKVQLRLDPTGHGSVVVDGVDISRGVQGLSLRSRIDHLTELTLDLAVFDVAELDVEGATILVPDGTRDALVALGWTPPDA